MTNFATHFWCYGLKKKRNKKWKAIIVNTLYNPINMCIVDVTILVSSHLFKSRQLIKRSGTHMMKPTCSCFTWSQHPWPYKPGWHHKILPSKPNQELITQVPVIMRYNFSWVQPIFSVVIRRKHATNLLSPSIQHYCNITQVSWCLKLLDTQLFVQLLVQTNNKEIIKAPYYWSFLGQLPMTGGFSSQKAGRVIVPWFHHLLLIRKISQASLHNPSSQTGLCWFSAMLSLPQCHHHGR